MYYPGHMIGRSEESNWHKISIATFGLTAILVVSYLFAGEPSLSTGLSIVVAIMVLGETPFWKSQPDGIYISAVIACLLAILIISYKPLVGIIKTKLLETTDEN